MKPRKSGRGAMKRRTEREAVRKRREQTYHSLFEFGERESCKRGNKLLLLKKTNKNTNK